MCFSAEASFTASALLCVMGYKTIQQARTPAQLPLAILPMLFSFHQLTEGILWLYFTHGFKPDWVFYFAQSSYVFLAYMFFLVWVPFSGLVLERIRWRRLVMFPFFLTACLLAGLNVDKLPGAQVVVQVIHYSLQYPMTDWVRGIPYLVAICTPMLFSSRRRLWCLGALGFISVAVAMYYYYLTFASVWCFFAGLISVSIYWIIKGLNEAADQSKLEVFSKERLQ